MCLWLTWSCLCVEQLENFNMANGLDRLEKFFSSKPSTNSSSSSSTIAWRSARSTRPRSSSLDSERREELTSVFRGFEFPKPPPSRQEDMNSPWSNYASKRLPSLPGGAPRPISPLRLDAPASRLHTPPSSDPEDHDLSQRRPKAKKLQLAPCTNVPLTPESSPEMGPKSDWQLHGSTTKTKPQTPGFFAEMQMHLEKTFGKADDCHSGTEAQPKSDPPSTTRSIDNVFEPSLSGGSLYEPDFDEFLNLSDDNVAEFDPTEISEVPEVLDTPRPATFSGTMSPSVMSALRGPRMLTLGPPYGSRASKAAAFEAARIASRYNFDMIYVVNLWPEDSSAGLGGPHFQAMTGRLLAAYGLHNASSPFQISSEAHVTVLRSQNWLEYRDEEALGRGFGRAYACSFYPGKYEGQGSVPCSPSIEPESIDRGIVFAAYRKPAADGSIQFSTPLELFNLRRDVEAMVEMLIDIHVANRLRQPPILTKFPDETGPIPSMQFFCA
ncbi:hypothetical protein GMORB2_7424 [Geosmithia morbida]|uniref:Uncharacterized protein n=1 Tax=Geosmithia morbida TaxID=1094350 RepID=A0A9P5D171_9HYPO|nr:uncharacterized protein GMORB2_7424 [Geosmithia morbida]KAF4122432.1 hypothetical protein GMORB2_7424 [Geosmithia morbida]